MNLLCHIHLHTRDTDAGARSCRSSKAAPRAPACFCCTACSTGRARGHELCNGGAVVVGCGGAQRVSACAWHSASVRVKTEWCRLLPVTGKCLGQVAQSRAIFNAGIMAAQSLVWMQAAPQLRCCPVHSKCNKTLKCVLQAVSQARTGRPLAGMQLGHRRRTLQTRENGRWHIYACYSTSQRGGGRLWQLQTLCPMHDKGSVRSECWGCSGVQQHANRSSIPPPRHRCKGSGHKNSC